MDNYYKNKYYTLDKIPKHRIDYINKKDANFYRIF